MYIRTETIAVSYIYPYVSLIHISSLLASLPSQESRARIAAMQARLAKAKAAPEQEALNVPGRVMGKSL